MLFHLPSLLPLFFVLVAILMMEAFVPDAGVSKSSKEPAMIGLSAAVIYGHI